MQVHGLQALQLYIFGKENFGKPVGCTSLFDLCLKFSADSIHGLEHVGKIELQAHLSVWWYTYYFR